MIGIHSHFSLQPPVSETSFIQQTGGTRTSTVYGLIRAAAHPSAVAGDLQFAILSGHVTVGLGTNDASWTQLSNTTSTHNRLVIYWRVATSGNATAPFDFQSHYDSRLFGFTYRGGSTLSVVGSGQGRTSPSRVISGNLLRVWGSAQDNSHSQSSMTLTPDAGLVNRVSSAYTNYSGIAFGEESGANGETAPTRTVSYTGSWQDYTQWVDLNIS